MNRIKELREQAGESRAQVAVLCGLGEFQVGRWERGQAQVPDAQKLRLAKHYGVSVEHLMGWDKDFEGRVA